MSMHLQEIFDTEADIVWQQQGRFELAEFVINDIKYIIQIEKKPISPLKLPELKGKKTAEVSFFVADKKSLDQAYSTTHNIGNAAPKVLSVVFHALLEKFKEYDAFYYILRPQHSDSKEQLETKRGIYLTLANNLATHSNLRVYDQRSNYGNAFLVSKIPIESNKDFINETLEYIKNVDWNKVPRI